jgi:hypothetical protein
MDELRTTLPVDNPTLEWLAQASALTSLIRVLKTTDDDFDPTLNAVIATMQTIGEIMEAIVDAVKSGATEVTLSPAQAVVVSTLPRLPKPASPPSRRRRPKRTV